MRDGFGVPAITGASEDEAWWGAGYATAEDRLFQLDLLRRATSGRLAELQGDDYLDDDLLARRDFYTDAEIDTMVARLPARLVRRVEAIRDGINAFTRRARLNPGLLPGEFAGTATLPRDWTVRDSARLGVYLARTVPSDNGAELRNLRALRAIGPAAFAKLLPLRTPGAVPTVPRSAGSSRAGPAHPARRAPRVPALGGVRTRPAAARGRGGRASQEPGDPARGLLHVGHHPRATAGPVGAHRRLPLQRPAARLLDPRAVPRAGAALAGRRPARRHRTWVPSSQPARTGGWPGA